MTKGNIKSKKGFTIIEVVLVLAIAGLIFLMVFIALPALQRSQRNTARQADLSRILTAVNTYATNNKGRLPFPAAANINNLVRRYIDPTCSATVNFTSQRAANACDGDQLRDPDGALYFFVQITAGNVDANNVVQQFPDTGGRVNHTIYYITNATCGTLERSVRLGTTGTAYNAANSRQVALFMILEGGAVTCVSTDG